MYIVIHTIIVIHLHARVFVQKLRRAWDYPAKITRLILYHNSAGSGDGALATQVQKSKALQPQQVPGRSTSTFRRYFSSDTIRFCVPRLRGKANASELTQKR